MNKRLVIKDNKILIEDTRLELFKGLKDIISPSLSILGTAAEDAINISTYTLMSILTVFSSKTIKSRVRSRYRTAYRQINSNYNKDISSLSIEESDFIYYLVSPGAFLSGKIGDYVDEKLSARGISDIFLDIEDFLQRPFSTLGDLTGLGFLGKINYSKIKDKLSVDIENSREAQYLGPLMNFFPNEREKEYFLRQLRRKNLNRSAKFFQSIFKSDVQTESTLLINKKSLILLENKSSDLNDLKKVVSNLLREILKTQINKASIELNKDLIEKNFNVFVKELSDVISTLNFIEKLIVTLKKIKNEDINKNNAANEINKVKLLLKEVQLLDKKILNEIGKLLESLSKEISEDIKDTKESLEKNNILEKALSQIDYREIFKEYNRKISFYKKCNKQSNIFKEYYEIQKKLNEISEEK